MASQVTTLFASVDKEGKIRDDHNGEEGQALMSLEESTEMTSVVTKTDWENFWRKDVQREYKTDITDAGPRVTHADMFRYQFLLAHISKKKFKGFLRKS